MSDMSTGAKEFEAKVSAQLQEAKSKIAEIEAQTKGRLAQAQVDAINGFHVKRQEIEKKTQDLKTTTDAKAAQAQAEIQSDISQLKTSVDQFAAQVKAKAAAQ